MRASAVTSLRTEHMCSRSSALLGKGTFEGPRLKGEVLAGGMDMKTVRADGAMNANPHT